MNDLALLVIIDSQDSPELTINTEEMSLLCKSAGVNLADTVTYKIKSVNPNYFLGKGQTQYLSDISYELNADVLIFSEDLTPTQIRNLENATDKRIVDRTQLILDIFAQRAKSNEGKIQVELAQLEYLLPRLTGKGIELSRIGGGSGVATRGPGETKLETDKRKIKEKISRLKIKLKEIEKQRNISSKNRLVSSIPSVALVGYTSAGKSTLLSVLSDENFYSDEMLFATLDSVTRKIKIRNNYIFLSDTVGFLQKLPHHLIAAFKSTLTEIKNSDILIHLVDATKPNIEENIETVNKVLSEININKPALLVFNKTDAIDNKKMQKLYYKYSDSVFISALSGFGFENLFSAIENILNSSFLDAKLLIPYSINNISLIYKYGKVYKTEYLENGIFIYASLPKEIYYNYQDYRI